MENPPPQSNPNVYEAPASELIDSSNSSEVEAFFPVSPGKLKVMYVATLGMYGLVWFYENWKRQKLLLSENTWPVMRAVFAIFFVHALFKRIHESALKLGKAGLSNHQNLASFYVIVTIASVVIDNVVENVDTLSIALTVLLSIISLATPFIALLPLLAAQKQANLINDDPEGLRNANFSAVNIIFIILGALFWLLIAGFLVIGLTGQ